MKRFASIAAGVIAGNILAASLLWIGPSAGAITNSSSADSAAPEAAAPSTGERAATQVFQPAAIGDELGLGGAGLASPGVLPTPIPNETQVYFVPTDNDATATVLYLYNTDSVAHIVPLRGFSYNGVLVYSLNINVGAESFVRMASDSIAAAPPPSWATPAPIITNFTDFTYFASLSLARGVRVEGYTLFNPGTGVVNPREDQGAIPLTFSTTPPVAPGPALPGVPLNLAATAFGGNLTITWDPPVAGGTADSYVLEAGSAPGLANLAVLPVLTTLYSTSGVPPGTYYLRVRAVNAVGTGPASAEVQLIVP